MREFYGVMLLDNTEIVLRVYQTNGTDWQLLHYSSKELVASKKTTTDVALIELITEFLAEPYTQQIIDWRICSRNLPSQVVSTIATATGFKIESLLKHREQELLCKGMFTELW